MCILQNRALKPRSDSDHEPAAAALVESVLENETFPNFVFVAGCGHTGTSVMAALLGGHSQIRAIPEETEAFLRFETREQVAASLERFASFAPAGAALICEKTPRHVRHVGRILAYFADSRVILMVRDGRDVVASLKRRCGELACSIRRWSADARETLRWRGADRVMLVRYEELVTDPQNTLTAVCGFLGLAYEDRMLRFHEDPRHWFGQTELRCADGVGEMSHRMRRNWQVHQPLFDGRGSWRTELSAEDLAEFARSGAELMLELGYHRAGGRG